MTMAAPTEARAAAAAKCVFCCVKTLVEMQNRIIFKVDTCSSAVIDGRKLYLTIVSLGMLAAQDAHVFGMVDRNPRAATHLLVIPHQHIASVNDLTPDHAELLNHMITTGKQLLAQEGITDPSQYQLGFHRPPFASVKHLHLHCLGYPFVPSWNRFRFTKTFLHSYIDAESVLAALQSPAPKSQT